MQTRYGVIFDGTLEGFLTIIYKYYYEKLKVESIVTEDGFQQTIDMEYVHVETNFDEAEKAMNGIKLKLGEGIYGSMCSAFSHNDTQRYIHIFRYIVTCFKYGPDADGYTQIDCVMRVKLYNRNIGTEVNKSMSFTRFEETESGVLYADMSPEHDVLAIVADFFTERLLGERWIIHDLRRGKAAVFDGANLVITDAPVKSARSKTFDIYQDLWKAFYDTIAIKERINPKLHRQFSPKRYWKHMTEHQHMPDSYTDIVNKE